MGLLGGVYDVVQKSVLEVPRWPLGVPNQPVPGASPQAGSFRLMGAFSRTRMGPWLLLLLGLGFLDPLPAPVEGQAPPPAESYRTFDTPHFRVVYAEGLQEVAFRAAAHAEEGHRILTRAFFPPPEPRIEILVTDHVDLSNGFATSVPAPRITLWARPPVDGTTLSHYDDWIEMVTLHELAHIFHLERTHRLGEAARQVFGRAPAIWPFFSGYLLPTWGIEGVAVQLESTHTAAGRIHGTGFQSVVRAQALEGEVEALGQALGRSPVWPGGMRPYVFGSLFFHWLQDEYGDEAVRDFLEASARQWIPFRLNAAAREATGKSLDALWEEWQAEVNRELQAAGKGGEPFLQGEDGVEVTYLTRNARTAAHPAPGPEGQGLAYLRADGRSDTRLVLRDGEGGEETLSRWNWTAGPLSWTADGALLGTQPEFVDRWRMRQDLYRVEPGGRVHRLTRGLRLSHVDAHPAEGRIVAVQEGEGTNRLVLLDGEGELTAVLAEGQPHVQWAFPRWSPDGTRLVAARRIHGQGSGIVVLELAAVPGEATLQVVGQEVIHQDRALHTTPTWSPDGAWIIWSGDRDGAMNLLAREVDPEGGVGALRQITYTLTGASQPAVDQAGQWLVYAVQGAQGWDLVHRPFRPQAWGDPSPPAPRFVAREGGRAQVVGRAELDEVAQKGDGSKGEGSRARAALRPPPAPPAIVREDRPWSALSSARPRYWLPTWHPGESEAGERILSPAVGIMTSGRDLVGRHDWFVSAAIPIQDPGSRLELRARWSWAGMGQPQIALVAEESHETLGTLALPQDLAQGEDDRVVPTVRERRIGVDLPFVRARARSGVGLTLGAREIRETRRLLEMDGSESRRASLARPDRRLSELRGTLSATTVRRHPFSISPENGVSLVLQARERFHRSLPDSLLDMAGVDGSYREVMGVSRGFVPVSLPRPFPSFSRGALALRVAGGAATGPGAGANHFRLGGGGGASGDGPGGASVFETNPTFSVRGYPRGTLGGDQVWAASGEFRFPVANLHRGWGALPLHLDRVGGSLFLDAGGAGRLTTQGRQWDQRVSAGVEITIFQTLFFNLHQQMRGGVVVPLESGAGPGVYLQAGWSF
jgi:hypothetical protein